MLLEQVFNGPVGATIIGLLGTILIGTVVDRIRLGIRVTVLEALFTERSASVAALDVRSDDHASRLTAVEQVIPELRRLIEAMRDVPALLSALKAMMADDRERLRDVEGHVFPFNRRPDPTT